MNRDCNDHVHHPPRLAPLGCALLVPVMAPGILSAAHVAVHLVCWALGAPCP